MQSLCPPKPQLRIRVVLALFQPPTMPLQRCAQPWDAACLRDRANKRIKRGIAAQREALWGGAVHIRTQRGRGAASDASTSGGGGVRQPPRGTI